MLLLVLVLVLVLRRLLIPLLLVIWRYWGSLLLPCEAGRAAWPVIHRLLAVVLHTVYVDAELEWQLPGMNARNTARDNVQDSARQGLWGSRHLLYLECRYRKNGRSMRDEAEG